MPSRVRLKYQPRKITAFMRNSARSMGYLLTDTVREYNPVLAEMFDNAKETSSDLYSSIKEFSGDLSIKNVGREINETTKAIFSNFKDDLKTGNWYNKARQEKVVDVMGMMGFDESDFDFNFDDDDWGDEDFDSDSEDNGFEDDTKAILSENQKSTQQIISSVDRTGYAIASTVNQGQMQSAGMIIEANNQQTQALYSLNQKGFTSVTEAILGLNKTVAAIGQLGQPLTVHMQNASVFYTKTSEQLTSISEKLDQIVKNTTVATSSGSGRNSRDTTFSDLFGSGMFDAKSYVSMVKENFKDDKELIDMFTGAMKHVNLKNISPGVMISRMVTHAIIPKMFKDTMKEFNDTIKDAINDMAIKAGYKISQGNGIISMLFGDYLLPKNTFGKLKEFDTSRYEKGAIQWDGIAKKALTEVIPTTLLNIYSAITGSPEMRYDYKAGKFVKASSAAQLLQDKKLSAAREAGGELRNLLMSDLDTEYSGKRESSEYKRLKAEAEKFFIQQVLESDDPYVLAKLISPNAANIYNSIDPKILRKLSTIIKNKSNASKIRGFNATRFGARASYNESMTNSHDELSLLANLYNNSTGWNQKGTVNTKVSPMLMDENGVSIFNYMGLIHDRLGDIYAAITGKEAKYYNPKTGRYNKRSSFAGKGGAQSGERSRRDIDLDQNARNQVNIQNQLDIAEEELLGEEGKAKGFKERYKEAKGRVYDYFKDKGFNIKSVSQAPFIAASSLITKVSDALTRVIIGDPNDPESGIMGKITTKVEDMFDKLSEKLRDIFDNQLKDTLEKLFGKKDENGNRQGGIFSDIYNESKKSLRAGWDYTKKVAGEYAFGKAQAKREAHNKVIQAKKDEIAKYKEELAELDAESATGSGLLYFLSGGAAEQMTRAEQMALAKKLKGSIKSEKGKKYADIKIKKYKAQNKIDLADNVIRNSKKRKTSDTIEAGSEGDGGIIGNVAYSIIDFQRKLKAGSEAFFGKEDADKFELSLGKLGEDLKAGKGNIGAGALVGMGAGALMGAPMLGLMAGSAIGFIKSSDTAKNFLFGELDENGERAGGVLGKEFSNFVQKNGLQKTGASAALGAGVGLFMGSPVLGAVLGGSIGFIKSSDEAKEFLFGKKDDKGEYDDSGVIPKKIMDQFRKNKHLAPLLGAGAGIGALMGGPFGVAGGLAIAAGINYFNTEEQFRERLFGENGPLKEFKEKIFDNINEHFHNTSNAIKGWLKQTGRNLFDMLHKGIKEKVFGTFGKWLRNALDKTNVGQRLLGIGATVRDKAGNLLLGGANRRMAANIQKGYRVYNKKYGRDMTSAEIAEAMQDPTRDLTKYFGRGKKGQENQQAFIDEYTELGQMDKEQRSNKIKELLQKENDKSLKRKERNRAFQLRQQLQYDQEMEDKKKEENPNLEVEVETKNAVLQIRDAVVYGKKTDENGKPIAESIDKAINNSDTNAASEESGTQTTQTFFGNMQQKKNEQGEIEEDTSDKETKKAIEKREKFLESVNAVPALKEEVGGIRGFFGNLKKKLFGDKDSDDDKEKKGLFGKLGDLLFGSGLKALITTVVAPALLAGGFSGLFDKVGKAIGRLGFLQGNDAKSTLSDDKTYMVNNQLIQTDENGEPIMDENGNFLTVDGGEPISGNLVNIGQQTGIRSNLIHNLVVRTALSKGKDFGISSMFLKHSKFGKGLTKTGKAIVSGAKTVGKGLKTGVEKIGKFGSKLAGTKVGKAVTETVTKNGGKLLGNIKYMVDDALEALAKGLSYIPLFPKDIAKRFPSCIDDISEQIMKHIATNKKAMTMMAANVSDFIPIAGQVIYITTMVVEGINAWSNAETVLGITEKATAGQRCIATLIACLNNLIPGIGGVIPNKVFVNIFMSVADKLGIAPEELKSQRARAAQEVEDYNLLHGTDLNIEEYNKLHGITDAISFTSVRGFIQGKRKQAEIQAKKEGKTLSEILEEPENERIIFGVSEQAVRETAQKTIEILAAGLKAVPFFPDEFAEGLANTSETLAAAISTSMFERIYYGGYKELLLSTNVVVNAVKKTVLIPKALYGWANAKNIMGISGKCSNEQRFISMMATVFAFIYPGGDKDSALERWIKIFTKLAPEMGLDPKKVSSQYSEDEELKKYKQEYAAQSKSIPKLVDAGTGYTFEAEKPKGNLANFLKANPVGGSGSGLRMISGGASGVAGAPYTMPDNSKQAQDMLRFASNGDVQNLISYQTPTEGGVGNNMMSSVPSNVVKYSLLPSALVSNMGQVLSQKMKGLTAQDKEALFSWYSGHSEVSKDIVKMGDESIGAEDLFKISKEGDIKKFMTFQPNSIRSDDNKGLALLKNIPVTAAKYSIVGPTLMTNMGKKIAKKLQDIQEKASKSGKLLASSKDKIWEAAKQGDIKGVWTVAKEDDEGNPITGFVKGLNTGFRLIVTPVALVSMVGRKIADFAVNAAGKVKNNFNILVENDKETGKLALAGDVKGMWTREFKDDPENPAWGFTKALVFSHKLALTPLAGASWVGHRIFDGWMYVKDKIVHGSKVLYPNFTQVDDLTKQGDFQGIWKHDFENDEENPVGGFAKGIYYTYKAFKTPIALAYNVGAKIGDFAVKIGKGIKNNVVALGKNSADLGVKVAKGDVTGIWSEPFQEDEDSPVLGFTKVLHYAHRLAVTPVAASFFVGNKVREFIGNNYEKIKHDASMLYENGREINGYIGSGDVVGMWKRDFKDDEQDPAWWIVKAMSFMHKLTGTPIAAASWVGHRVGELVSGMWKNVSYTATHFDDELKRGDELFYNPDATFKDYFDIGEMPASPLSDTMKAVLIGARLVSIPKAVLTQAGKYVIGGLLYAKDRVVHSVQTLAPNFEQVNESAKLGDIDRITDIQFENDPNDPVGGFTKGIFTAFKYINYPRAYMHYAGNIIKENVITIGEQVRHDFGVMSTNFSTAFSYVYAGDSEGLWSQEFQNDEGNPIGGFGQGILTAFKVIATPTTWVVHAGRTIVEKVKSIKNAVSEGSGKLNNSFTDVAALADKGDLEGVWKYEFKDSEDNPVSGFAKGIGIGFKLIQTPEAMVKLAGNKIKDVFKDKVDLAKTNYGTLMSEYNKLVNYAKSSDFNSLMNAQAKFDEKDPLHGLWSLGFDIMRVSNVATALFGKVTGKVKDVFGTIKDKFGEIKDNILGKIENTGDAILSGARRFVGVEKEESGSGSGFVSQFDSAVANKQMVGGNFATQGCGPSVATMVANAYGIPTSVNSALSDSKQYQNPYGVSLDYFGDTLAKKGIKTQFISGGSSGDIYQSLAAGHPTILLGQDASNTSKEYSPFGPRNHYVFANGLDSRGNVIISDPELGSPRVYDPSILKSAKFAMATSASGSRLSPSQLAALMSAGGADYKSQIWGYLKKQGFNDYAIAGLMGCWEAESHNNPDTLEGNYALKEDPHAILADPTKLNAYAERVFVLHKVSENAKQYYKGSDGNYYPGYGLAQWTGPRHQAVMEWAESQNKDYTRLGTQLGYTMSEIEKRPTYQQRADAATDVNSGVIAALDQFENSSDNFHVKHEPQYSKRLGYANEIYNQFAGTDGSPLEEDDGSFKKKKSTPGQVPSVKGASNTGGSILSKVITAFTNGFAKIIGGSNTSDTGSSAANTVKNNTKNKAGSNTGENVAADNSTWISQIETVKKAVAEQAPTYQDPMYRDIYIDGAPFKYRVDCTGLVDLICHYGGYLDKNHYPASSEWTSGVKLDGFTKMEWPGWDGLQRGDIIARDGHVEIYSHTENGQHYVWNGGSTKALSSAVPTVSGHSGYTTIYRINESGGASGLFRRISRKLLSRFSGGNSAVDSPVAQQVWSYFSNKGMSPAGIAGILGNMQHESGMFPARVQGDYSNGYANSLNYTEQVDSGAVSEEDFVKHGPGGGGYGLVQFTYGPYKKALYANAKSSNASISDVGVQLDTLDSQIGGVVDKLMTADNPAAAASVFLREYEKPKDISGTEPDRQSSALGFYNMYAGKTFGDAVDSARDFAASEDGTPQIYTSTAELAASKDASMPGYSSTKKGSTGYSAADMVKNGATAPKIYTSTAEIAASKDLSRPGYGVQRATKAKSTPGQVSPSAVGVKTGTSTTGDKGSLGGVTGILSTVINAFTEGFTKGLSGDKTATGETSATQATANMKAKKEAEETTSEATQAITGTTSSRSSSYNSSVGSSTPGSSAVDAIRGNAASKANSNIPVYTSTAELAASRDLSSPTYAPAYGGTRFPNGSPIEYMQSKLGQLEYSMDGPRNPDKNSADCSSTVNWAIRQAGGPDIGVNTLKQYTNENLETIAYNNGAIFNAIPEEAQPNDVLFFSRPTSDYTYGRPDRVGHVGLYMGNNQYIDHGGPKKGPIIKDGPGKNLIKVSRVKMPSATGSGLLTYKDIVRMSGGDSGITGLTDTDITTQTSNLLTGLSNQIQLGGANGTISMDVVTKLLQAITKLLERVVMNTGVAEKIYNLLEGYTGEALDLQKMSASGSDSGLTPPKKGSQHYNQHNPTRTRGYNDEVDPSFQHLIKSLAKIAEG